MLQRFRLALLILALVCWVPSAALSEEGDGTDPKPKKDEPAPDKPTPDKPTPDKPTPDKPTPDKPAPDKPAPDEPVPDKPAPDEPGPDGPTPDKPAPDKPAPDEPAPEEPKDGPPADDASGRITNKAIPPVPAPAGMAYIEGGRVMIGTPAKQLSGMLEGRPADIQAIFLHESPYHPYFLRPYFIGKYEVTNAQYKRFLDDNTVEYDTSSGSLANLDEITAYLTKLDKKAREDPKLRVWAQLYFANKDAIWKAFGDRIDSFMVRGRNGQIDEEATAKKFRFEPLPRTLKLKFVSMKPPRNWPALSPPKGEEDHPVRYVSYNDAERFAEWAGMHIPTEYEWEWAARGPGGPMFPWGDEWVLNEKLANWGGKITDEHYEPTTLSVATRWGKNPDGKAGKKVPIDGDGRSWAGLHHMVGNVAEWTSSWFGAYRDNRHDHTYMGHYVKVIRGGSVGDLEMIVLRPGCRNFIGGGRNAPPFPDNDFKWVGFRLASYMKSGRDQLEPLTRRAVRVNKVKRRHLDNDGFIGAVTRNWVEPTATPENHVYVLGRSRSIILLPLKKFLWEEGLEKMRNAWRRPTRYKTTKGLSKQTEEERPTFLVGVLHTDIPLEPVLVRKKVDPTAEEDDKKKKKKRKRRGRGRARAPETEEGKCPAGTYLLGVWFGKLALLDPAKEFVCFLPLAEKQKSHFAVKKVKAEDRQPAKLAVDAELDWADFSFDMPLGGKNIKEELRLIVSGRFQFEVGSLEAAGTWIQEDPAAEITAKLHEDWLEAESGKKKRKPKSAKKKADPPAKPGDKPSDKPADSPAKPAGAPAK